MPGLCVTHDSASFEGIDLDGALPERSHPSHCLLDRREESDTAKSNKATNGTSAAREPLPDVGNQVVMEN